MIDPAATTPLGYKPRYVSPFGRPRGLAWRLREMARRLSTDRSAPWMGLGLLEDIQLAAQILDRREWLEIMRLSDDPDAQRFAQELLDTDETMDAVFNAADHAKHSALPHERDPVRLIEELDDAAGEARAKVEGIREILIEVGALADDDEETDAVALLRALLS